MLVWGAAALPDRWREAACRNEAAAAIPWILNSAAAAVSALPDAEWRRRLRRSGIAASERPEREVRRYRVAVFHLEAVHIRRLKGAFAMLRPLPGAGSGWAAGGAGGGRAAAGGVWAAGGAGSGRGGAGARSTWKRAGNRVAVGAGNGLAAAGAGSAWTGERAGNRVAIGAGNGWAARGTGGKSGNAMEGGGPERPLLLRRLGMTGVRAAYALGLDAAVVDVDIDDDEQVSVRQFALPGESGRLDGGLEEETEAIIGALHAFAGDYSAACFSGGMSGAEGVLLGADPEFVLLKADGRVASAARLGGLGSPVGSDVVLSRRRLVHPVAEIRPAPADNPNQLAANVRRLLAQAAARMVDAPLRMLAGAMPVPGLALGGHLHLSGVWLSSRLLRALDSYIALPFALAEDPRGRARRPRYGMLGDFRRQPHGGFEYRTLPSWLFSPAAAKAAFALALLAAADSAALRYLPSLDERYAEAYYAGDVMTLRGCLDGLENELRSAPSYSRYAEWIEPFLQALRRGRRWDETADLRDKWRLRPPPGRTARDETGR